MAIHVITVMLFLWFIKSQRAIDHEMYRAMHEDHLEARSRSVAALEENTKSNRETTVALKALEVAVSRCER